MNESFNQIINSEKPTLVDFFATWCGPCKAQTPIIEGFAKQKGDQVRVLKIDIDKNQKVAEFYRIQSVPTLVMFKNGKILWRKSGVSYLPELENELRKAK